MDWWVRKRLVYTGMNGWITGWIGGWMGDRIDKWLGEIGNAFEVYMYI